MKIFCGVLALALVASAQSPETVLRAARTVAHLHDTMLDPSSFVLEWRIRNKAEQARKCLCLL